MTIITTIIALLLSVVSFAFSVYQYRILHWIRVEEKRTTLLHFANELRRKSEDLKNKIESTDDIDDCSEFFVKINALLEQWATRLASSQAASWKFLLRMEQELLPLELEIDLLHKQVVVVDKFNEEVRDYEIARRVQ